MTAVEGLVEPGFGAVADAFAANFAEHGEVGAGFCLYAEGRPVVDVWGGVADAGTSGPYADDTLQLVFSTTKGLTAVCANLLAQRGELDIDAPVTRYWPEFGAEGKDTIPVRWLLSHQAGLPVVDRRLTLEEALAWEPVVAALEAQKPVWPPGTAHGYHAVTFGWLVGEVVRRVSGRSLGTFFADEVAGPLGLELWIGLPEEHDHRVAPLITLSRPHDPALAALYDRFLGPETLLGRALSAPSEVFRDNDVWNRRDVRAAEIPAANAVGNARSVARMYAACLAPIDGVRLLDDDQVAAARTPLTDGNDLVLFVETLFGLGFMCSSPFSPFGGPASFGHPGAGGSLGFADPEHGLAVGYVMNRMQQNLAGDPRTLGLIRASYDAVGAPVTLA